jgi:hypothetical protein
MMVSFAIPISVLRLILGLLVTVVSTSIAITVAMCISPVIGMICGRPIMLRVPVIAGRVKIGT